MCLNNKNCRGSLWWVLVVINANFMRSLDFRGWNCSMSELLMQQNPNSAQDRKHETDGK